MRDFDRGNAEQVFVVSPVPCATALPELATRPTAIQLVLAVSMLRDYGKRLFECARLIDPFADSFPQKLDVFVLGAAAHGRKSSNVEAQRSAKPSAGAIGYISLEHSFHGRH